MGRWAAILAALACIAAAPANLVEPYTHAQRLVRLPDGRRINLYCLGHGRPTVILDSGWAATTFTWSDVQPRLARTTRACAFDRAGMGFSDPGPLPRDTRAIVDDLAATLKAAHISGPYVLVGHSTGALDMRLFASLRRGETAGLVLVDPASEHQDGRMGGRNEALVAKLKACAEAGAAGRLTAGAAEEERCVGTLRAGGDPHFREVLMAMKRTAGYQATLYSEYDNLAGRDSDQIDAAKTSFGDRPLIVLTAEKTGQEPGMTPEQQAFATSLWRRMHDETAALSRRGVNRIVAGAGHNIPTEKPDAVAGAIEEVVAQARR